MISVSQRRRAGLLCFWTDHFKSDDALMRLPRDWADTFPAMVAIENTDSSHDGSGFRALTVTSMSQTGAGDE